MHFLLIVLALLLLLTHSFLSFGSLKCFPWWISSKYSLQRKRIIIWFLLLIHITWGILAANAKGERNSYYQELDPHQYEVLIGSKDCCKDRTITQVRQLVLHIDKKCARRRTATASTKCHQPLARISDAKQNRRKHFTVHIKETISNTK